VTINRNLCSSWTGTGRGFGTVKRREWRSSSVVGDELLKRPMEVVAIFDGDLVANDPTQEFCLIRSPIEP
jgi:hypothetical protein